jgi:hypothetical protein
LSKIPWYCSKFITKKMRQHYHTSKLTSQSLSRRARKQTTGIPRWMNFALLHCLLILKSTASAFQTHHRNYRIHMQRIAKNSIPFSFNAAVSTSSFRRQQRNTDCAVRLQQFRLYMVKNRVGLEQRRENATPTGAIVELKMHSSSNSR